MWGEVRPGWSPESMGVVLRVVIDYRNPIQGYRAHPGIHKCTMA